MFRSKKAVNHPSRLPNDISADHQRLIALINSMSDAVLAVSPDGNVQICNGAALDLFDNNNLIGKNIAEFINLLDVHGQKYETALVLNSRSNFFNRELKLKYHDGSLINVELSVSPVRLSFGLGDGGFVILARDITEAKSLEDERDEFISVASHELRTPIAIAEGDIGNALILAEKTGSSDTVIKTLSAAHDQVVFLGYLINDLSMLSRAESKNKRVETRQINAGKIISGLVEAYKERASNKNLDFTYETEGDDLYFEANDLYVKEILQNFITNSIKYTDNGTVHVSAGRQGEEIIFSVSDSGFGISKSEQQKLFSKFFRSADPRIQQSKGTGLGLYVCAKLAKLMKGRVEVDSSLNHGSTFRLILPVKQN